MIAEKVTDHIYGYIEDVDHQHAQDFAPLHHQKQTMKQNQRKERANLKAKQQQRQKQEARDRANRHAKGLKGLWDRVSGHYTKIKTQNEHAAWDAAKRDQRQRDHLVMAHLQERQMLQKQIDALRRKHTQNRTILARDIASTLRMADQMEQAQSREPVKVRRFDRGPSL